jgi:vacuolar protein sorting-associated protein 29
VDILVTGHTHVFESYEYQVWWNAKTSTDWFSGKVLCEPWICNWCLQPFDKVSYVVSSIVNLVFSDVIPTFVLMDIQGSRVITYVYQLKGADVKVEKMEYTKPE